MTARGASGRKDTLVFNTGDYIGKSLILVIVQAGRIIGLESRCQDHGAHIEGQLLFRVFVVNGPGGADPGAGPAFIPEQLKAEIGINGVFQGHGLGIVHIDGLAFDQTLVKIVRGLARTFFGTLPAGDALVHVHIAGGLFQGDFKIPQFTVNGFNSGQGVQFNVQVPADLDQFR